MSRTILAFFSIGCCLLAGAAFAQSQDKNKDEEEVRVYTNADLPSQPGSAGKTPVSALAQPTKLVAPLSYDGYRDRDGHGQGWWRQRAANMDVEVMRARLTAEQLHVDYVKGKKILDPTLAGRSRDATAAWKRIEAERETLGEELRRAGGLPGWLRRGGSSLPSEVPGPPAIEAAAFDGSTLSWMPVMDAAFYIIEVQCTDCCRLGPCDVETLDTSRASVSPPFDSGSTVRWRVRSLDNAGFGGDWSDWQEFSP